MICVQYGKAKSITRTLATSPIFAHSSFMSASSSSSYSLSDEAILLAIVERAYRGAINEPVISSGVNMCLTTTIRRPARSPSSPSFQDKAYKLKLLRRGSKESGEAFYTLTFCCSISLTFARASIFRFFCFTNSFPFCLNSAGETSIGHLHPVQLISQSQEMGLDNTHSGRISDL